MMVKLFVITFIIFLFFKILFSLKKNLKLKYIFTPLVTLTLILMSLYFLYFNFNKYTFLIIIGLIFSLIGDVFNMLEPPEYNFVDIGGFFFLWTHVFYILAFLRSVHFNKIDIILIAVLIIIISMIFLIIFKNAKNNFLKIGFLIYIIAVSFSFYSALSGFIYFYDLKSVLSLFGIFLFWLSDLILGYHLLIKKIKLENLFVWGLYAPGQLLISLSVFFN